MPGASKKTLDEVAEIQELVRSTGLRCTAARMAVIQGLRQVTSPITHAELADNLQSRGFDRATVYRNLISLTEVGLVARAELGDHVWRFEIRDPNHKHDDAGHPHFVCVDCGSVTCLSDMELSNSSRKHAAKVGEVTEILLRGHCKTCS